MIEIDVTAAEEDVIQEATHVQGRDRLESDRRRQGEGQCHLEEGQCRQEDGQFRQEDLHHQEDKPKLGRNQQYFESIN